MAEKKSQDRFPFMKNPKMNANQNIFGNVFFWVFAGLILVGILSSMPYDQTGKNTVPISEIISKIKNKEVQKVVVDGDLLKVELKDGKILESQKENTISFEEMLSNAQVDRSFISGGVEVKVGIPWASFLLNIAQIVIPILFILFIFRQLRGGGGGDVFAFGKSRAKLFNKDSSHLRFSDVAGNSEAKAELVEIVDFLKNPAKYRALGARIPKGVLLVGPSGVGKTMLAKAIAGEAGVPFFSVAGSEFMEMLVGVGSARVRDLFEMAKTSQPSLIFIDEIDAIGRQRGMGIGGGHDEREQTLNQILVEMDGFDPRAEVIVLGATNRPDMLDPALIRPGRFDRRVIIMLPDLNERQDIIKIHMRGKPIVEGVDVEKLARRTVGFSGADIENMLNESAILAARGSKKAIDYHDLEEATLKVQLGPEKKKLQTEEERKVVAYHEAGHALVSVYVRGMDPVHRISIISRGLSLGHTLFPPSVERYNETKTRLMSMITTSLGGRAAEELVFNEQTVGAANDIEKATDVATKMVTEFGMSDLGPISYDSKGGKSWLAAQMEEGQGYSQEVAAKIDGEVKKIITTAYNEAKKVLTEHRNKLDAVALELMKKETLEAEEFQKLLVD